MFDVILYVFLVAAGVFVAWTVLHGYWRGLGVVSRAPGRPAPAPCIAAPHLAGSRRGRIARSRRRPGRPGRSSRAAVHVHRGTFGGLAAVHLGRRRARPPLARQVGPRGPAGNLRGPSRMGLRVFRRRDVLRRIRHSGAGGQPSACRRMHRRDDRPVRERPVRAGRSSRQEVLRRAQLGVERQPVRRHEGARRAEDRGDAAVQLGHEGSPRRGARIEHGDLRGARLPPAVERRGKRVT